MDEFEDIEMMDIEDIPESVLFSNKRKSIKETNNVFTDNNKSDINPINLELRTILRAKRVLPKVQSLDTKESNEFNIRIDEKLKPICVLDTNVLLSNLTELKDIILVEESLKKNNKSKLHSIVIPWIVVQELDRMKSRKVDKSVVNVIHFINEQLKKSNGIIKGENVFKSKSLNKFEGIEEEINDDKILNSCLKIKSYLPSNDIILITNDLNLNNKALMTHLKALNWKEFLQKYKSSDFYSICTQTEDEDEDQTEPKCKRLANNHSKHINNNKSGVSKFRISTKEKLNKNYEQIVSTHSLEITQKSNSLSKYSPTRRQKSPNKQKSVSGNPSKAVPQINSLCKPLNSPPNECLKYEEWIRFKEESEQLLLKFVINIYQEIWDNDWQQMLEIDINNTNLKDIIRVMRKEWNSNFSDHFNRDKSVKELVDSLHSSLTKSSINYHLYYKDLKHFIDLIKQKQTERQKESLKRNTI